MIIVTFGNHLVIFFHRTGGNSWSSGPAPPPPPFTPPPPSRRSNPGQHSGGSSSPSGGGGKSSGIGVGVIAGIIISIFVIGGIIAFFLIRKKTQRSSREGIFEQDQPFTPLAPKEVKGNYCFSSKFRYIFLTTEFRPTYNESLSHHIFTHFPCNVSRSDTIPCKQYFNWVTTQMSLEIAVGQNCKQKTFLN